MGSLGQKKYPLLSTQTITNIAYAHDISAAHVLIRWHLQHGFVVFPGSTEPQHTKDNANVFGFDLTVAEVDVIDALDQTMTD